MSITLSEIATRASVSAVSVPPTRLLRESVYDQLRTEILHCSLAPGADIREADLAARFQVSKSPVRDALMRLEREGLVITLPRQGYRVAPISVSDVQDMFHLRAALERACMERIVRQATDAQLATLDQFRRFEAERWDGEFVIYNRAFHRGLAELASNSRMRDQLGNLIDEMERAVLVSVSNAKNSASLVDEHCAIIDALQARRVKPAEKLAEQHIAAAAKRVNAAIARMAVSS